ncbi:DUF4408 domain protein [Quillaja saponaria]|uniref:DUF4408 domain protein n=1 Tax=Quillaja saponaria TaxID=32244 RepID=A0AAD7PQG5_QUISA|nr:DUF4408 domain protein [Quillaja saponaria]
MMNKFKKSQILILSLLAILLIVTPFLSSSVRPTYLYFVFNFLIIALGAEAGLLSAFSKPLEDNYKKQPVPLVQRPVLSPETSPEKLAAPGSTTSEAAAPQYNEKETRVVKKSVSENSRVGAANMAKVKKCPSMPSLFFIGGGPEAEAEETNEEYELAEQEIEGISGQELYTKAETFIGNFYKQLKMQREDSWKKLHELYQKAF